MLIVDVESTCWENNNIPPNQVSEIIQIGICRLDPEGHIYRTASVYVKPGHSVISDFCTNLTGITSEKVKLDGLLYPEASELLKENVGSDKLVWGSWGAYDRQMFEKMDTLWGLKNTFSRRHVDIKSLFSAKHRTNKSYGVLKAMNKLNMEFEGKHHDGLDDAYNIARIMRRIL